MDAVKHRESSFAKLVLILPPPLQPIDLSFAFTLQIPKPMGTTTLCRSGFSNAIEVVFDASAQLGGQSNVENAAIVGR